MKRTDAALIPLKGSNKKAAHRAINNGFKKGFFNIDVNLFILLYFFFQMFTQKTFGFYKKYYDEDDESVCIFVFA